MQFIEIVKPRERAAPTFGLTCDLCGHYLRTDGVCMWCEPDWWKPGPDWLHRTLNTETEECRCAHCRRPVDPGYSVQTRQGRLCEPCLKEHERPRQIDGDPPTVTVGKPADLLADALTVRDPALPQGERLAALTRLRNDRRFQRPVIIDRVRWRAPARFFEHFRYSWSISGPMGVWGRVTPRTGYKVSWPRAWHVLLQTSLYLAIMDPRRRDSHHHSWPVPFPEVEAEAYAVIRKETRHNVCEWLLDGDTPDDAMWKGEVIWPAFRTRPAADLYAPTSQPMAPYSMPDDNRLYRRANAIRGRYDVRLTTEATDDVHLYGGGNTDPIGDYFVVPAGSGYRTITEDLGNDTRYGTLGAADLGSLEDALNPYERPRGAPYPAPNDSDPQNVAPEPRPDQIGKLQALEGAGLTPYERQILAYAAELPPSVKQRWKHIAPLMDKSPNAIRQAADRIRKKLRTKFGEDVTF